MTLSDATDSESAASASVAATPKAVKDAKEAVIGTDSDPATADTVKGAKKAVAAEETARQTDVGAILAGTKHAVGTVVCLGVDAKEGVAGTFTLKEHTGYTVHIMRVEWEHDGNHEDFVCKHNGEDIILWDSTTSTEDFTMPAATEIKVFALVTGTTAKAEGVTA